MDDPAVDPAERELRELFASTAKSPDPSELARMVERAATVAPKNRRSPTRLLGKWSPRIVVPLLAAAAAIAVTLAQTGRDPASSGAARDADRVDIASARPSAPRVDDSDPRRAAHDDPMLALHDDSANATDSVVAALVGDELALGGDAADEPGAEFGSEAEPLEPLSDLDLLAAPSAVSASRLVALYAILLEES